MVTPQKIHAGEQMTIPAPHPLGAALALPLGEIRADDADNPRFVAVEGGSDEPGLEASSVAQLAESMKKLGQLQNVGVRWDGERWRLAFGFRRYKAAKLAGLATLRAVVVEDPAAAVTENVHKRLQPVEMVLAIRRLRDVAKLPHPEIALRCGLSSTLVDLYARLGRLLHPRLLEAWQRAPGSISARELADVAQQSRAEQLVWLQRRQEGPPKEERIGERRKRRATAKTVRAMVERGELPELEKMKPRAAALAVLEMLGAK